MKRRKNGCIWRSCGGHLRQKMRKLLRRRNAPGICAGRPSTGICTAALLCVVIAAASIHSKMPDGTNQLEVVPPAAVTTAVEPEERPDTETEPAATAETTLPETASDADAAVQSSANTEMKTIAEEPGDIPEVIEGPADNTAPQTTGKHNAPAVTTAVPQTSKPAETAPCSGDFEESGHCDNGCTGGDNTAGDLKGAGNGDSSHPAEHLPVL